MTGFYEMISKNPAVAQQYIKLSDYLANTGNGAKLNWISEKSKGIPTSSTAINDPEKERAKIIQQMIDSQPGGDGKNDQSDNESGLGFMDGLAAFGMNAIGVATGLGPIGLAALGYGVANNNRSLSTTAMMRGIGEALGFGDNPGIGGYGSRNNSKDDPGVAGVPGGVMGRGTEQTTDPSSNPGKGDNGTGLGVGGGFGSVGPSSNPNSMSDVGAMSAASLAASMSGADSPGDDSGGGTGGGQGGPDGGGPGDSGGGGTGGGEGGPDGYKNGGLVVGPGDGDDDAIKARLSNGEFVVPAHITKNFLPLLEYLRKHGSLPKMN